MKSKIFSLLLLFILFIGCSTRPINFTYYYEGRNTGLDRRIDINGYFVSQHGCDSTFYSIYMFYSNGLFCIATTSNVSADLIKCFADGGESNLCRYPSWGTYRIEGDTIKTQSLANIGTGYVIFRDYLIMPDESIVNLSDYVEPQHTNLGYMENYPSLLFNTCPKMAKFYSSSKRDSSDCPYLCKRWFWKNL